MRSLFSRPVTPTLLCAAAAVIGGVAAGGAAVHGLRPNRYGPAEPPSLFARAEAAAPTDTGPDGELDVAARCNDCSERDLGYRWAALASVRLPGQCPHDSWAFRRGCLDYVGGI